MKLTDYKCKKLHQQQKLKLTQLFAFDIDILSISIVVRIPLFVSSPCACSPPVDGLFYCLKGQTFPKHDPVTVGCDNCKFAHAPGLVFKFVPDLDTVPDDLFV
jgi:hypothetical protein